MKTHCDPPRKDCRKCWHESGQAWPWVDPPTAQSRPATAQGPARAPCRFGPGERIRLQDCTTCAGNVRIAVFACDVHGECSIAKPLPGVSGCCKGCQEYVAKS